MIDNKSTYVVMINAQSLDVLLLFCFILITISFEIIIYF